MADLRVIAKEKGLSQGGTKDKLLERIEKTNMNFIPGPEGEDEDEPPKKKAKPKAKPAKAKTSPPKSKPKKRGRKNVVVPTFD